jgi:hypothetical protein
VEQAVGEPEALLLGEGDAEELREALTEPVPHSEEEGELVIDANLDNWPEIGKNPDGTPNKFKKALKDFARSGPIGLQGLHGAAQAPVWYRNVKIKVLE